MLCPDLRELADRGPGHHEQHEVLEHGDTAGGGAPAVARARVVHVSDGYLLDSNEHKTVFVGTNTSQLQAKVIDRRARVC